MTNNLQFEQFNKPTSKRKQCLAILDRVERGYIKPVSAYLQIRQILMGKRNKRGRPKTHD